MKEALLELCFLGGIFSLGLIAHVIYASIKRFAAAAKEKNHQGIIFELVIILIIIAICIFIVKPFHMVGHLVSLIPLVQ